MSLEQTDSAGPEQNTSWHYHPDLPLQKSHPFVWPLSPALIWRWFARSWLSTSTLLVWFLLSLLVWVWCLPPLEQMKQLSFAWVGRMFLINAVCSFAVAGGLQMYLYSRQAQGKSRKFDHRDLMRNGPQFLFSDQVKDNMFWTLCSALPIWTAYQCLVFWAMANGWAPAIHPAENPIWFVLFFPLISLWSSMHFYWVHRALHWPPLYRRVHSLHHKNVNVGPWSGLAMHPVEHLIYFSNALIHFVLPSHPLHLLFHMFMQGLHPMASHSGYESLFRRGKPWVAAGDFFHQLHHRYFECNYGTSEMPWDSWFGSYHNGTAAATKAVQRRRKKMHSQSVK